MYNGKALYVYALTAHAFVEQWHHGNNSFLRIQDNYIYVLKYVYEQKYVSLNGRALWRLDHNLDNHTGTVSVPVRPCLSPTTSLSPFLCAPLEIHSGFDQ